MNANFSETNHGSKGLKEDPKVTESDGPAPGKERPVAADVYRFDDYRAFMMERFLSMQALDPAFSQRRLARNAGIANPGFFNEVIKARRRLSPAASLKMAKGLGLSEDETQFFSALVEYAETREPRAKLAAGKRVNELRDRKLIYVLGGGDTPVEGLHDRTGSWRP